MNFILIICAKYNSEIKLVLILLILKLQEITFIFMNHNIELLLAPNFHV